MKKRKFNTKLSLNKEKISNLNDVKGGDLVAYTQGIYTRCYDVTCVTCYGATCPADGRDCKTEFCTSQNVSELGCCPC